MKLKWKKIQGHFAVSKMKKESVICFSGWDWDEVCLKRFWGEAQSSLFWLQAIWKRTHIVMLLLVSALQKKQFNRNSNEFCWIYLNGQSHQPHSSPYLNWLHLPTEVGSCSPPSPLSPTVSHSCVPVVLHLHPQLYGYTQNGQVGYLTSHREDLFPAAWIASSP